LARAPGERDQRRTGVGGIDSALDQAVAFKRARHRCQRLLAQARPPSQLTLAESVLFVERDQQRAVGRPNVGKAGADEPLVEELVPALKGVKAGRIGLI
jgi:hypothetical protein